MSSLVCRASSQTLKISPITRAFASLSGVKHAQIERTTTKDSDIIPAEAVTKGEMSLVSGIPDDQIQSRKATIYLPSQSAMQSGSHNMRKWKLDFDTKERWENPLMGWRSSGDALSNTHVEFKTREAAIAYCETHGWNYEVKEPTLPTPKVKSYGANFSWNKRTRVASK